MLLLRRFGALSKSLSGGGQDQPKSISLIGAALREGIHAHLEHNQEENFGSACDDQNSLSTSDLSMDTLSENEDEGLGATKV